MLTVVNAFDYRELWSALVLEMAAAVILHSVVSAVEAAVPTRFAPDSVGKRT